MLVTGDMTERRGFPFRYFGLISAVALIATTGTAGWRFWPQERFARVAIMAIAIGLAGTSLGEWLKLHVWRTCS